MTGKATRPFVLHVDDKPDELLSWRRNVNRKGDVELVVCHPRDVEEGHLEKASLVLVDFVIEQWPERQAIRSLSLRPENGLALLSVLQAAATRISANTPRAFGLFTGKIADVARELVHQPHIVSRACNIEWVFEKTESELSQPRAVSVAELACAVGALPTSWPGNSPVTSARALRQWLKLKENVRWYDAAWRDVLRCRPPLHQFAEHTHGIGVLRWALHRILPYPTFLFDEAHLAARLRVSLRSLRASVDSAGFRKAFEPVRYRGALSGIAGKRWWRAGVESVVAELVPARPGDLKELGRVLGRRIPKFKIDGPERRFPVLDDMFVTKDVLATEGEVVEVRPDDWPPFADEAWALRSDLVDAPELKAIAVRDEVVR